MSAGWWTGGDSDDDPVAAPRAVPPALPRVRRSKTRRSPIHACALPNLLLAEGGASCRIDVAMLTAPGPGPWGRVGYHEAESARLVEAF